MFPAGEIQSNTEWGTNKVLYIEKAKKNQSESIYPWYRHDGEVYNKMKVIFLRYYFCHVYMQYPSAGIFCDDVDIRGFAIVTLIPTIILHRKNTKKYAVRW